MSKVETVIVTDTFPRNSDDYYGKAVYDLVRELVKLNVNISVLTPVHTELKDNSFRIISPKKALPQIKYITLILNFCYVAIRLLLLLIFNKQKVIHVQWVFPYGIIGVLLKVFFDVKVVITARGSDLRVIPNRSSLVKKLIEYSLRKADYVTCVSDELKALAIKLKARSDETTTIPSSVNQKVFNPNINSESIVRKYNLKDNFSILFVGNLIPLKGIKELLEGFGEYTKTDPTAKLLLIGSGPLEDYITNYINENQLQKNIVLVGKVPHSKISEYMNAVDCFILPSYSEGLPLVILEAMACGLPVIATRVGGIPEIVVDGNTGLLINSKSSTEINAAISKLKENEEMRYSIAKQALAAVSGRYSFQYAAKENYKVYQKVLE